MVSQTERKKFEELTERMANGERISPEEWKEYCEIGADMQTEHDERRRG